MQYKVYNGTSYHIDTPQEIVERLEYARVNNKRVLITYKKGYEDFTGYTKDGLNVHMYIGRSNGKVKIPLHIVSSRSRGGVALLDDVIENIVIK